MNLIEYLNQPFPKLESKWKFIIISAFVALFLIIFLPFGVTYMQSSYKLLILSGYGLVTFIILFFNLIMLKKLFLKPSQKRTGLLERSFAG